MDPDTCLYYRDKVILLYDLTCSNTEKAREFFTEFRREVRRDLKRSSRDTAASPTAEVLRHILDIHPKLRASNAPATTLRRWSVDVDFCLQGIR
jgi:hypothetical protein